MAENLTQNQIITIAGRKKMLRARAGEIQLPKIVGFVFGDGGVDADGNVIAPLEAESELKNELLRKKYDTYTMLSDTKCKYECELKESELPGAAISEIGLYDADGDIVTIKRFTAKGKDADLYQRYILGRQDMAKNLTIQDEPVYNEQMEALEPTTPAHADYFNERYAQLLNNGKANRRDAKIFEDDVNGGKMRLGMENGHLYYEEL